MEGALAQVKLWVLVAQWIFNLLVSVWLYLLRRQAATNKRVEDLCDRIERTEKEMIKVSERLDQQPNQRQFEALGRDIRLLTKEMGEVKGKLGSLGRILELMNEFLINQGKK